MSMSHCEDTMLLLDSRINSISTCEIRGCFTAMARNEGLLTGVELDNQKAACRVGLPWSSGAIQFSPKPTFIFHYDQGSTQRHRSRRQHRHSCPSPPFTSSRSALPGLK